MYWNYRENGGTGNSALHRRAHAASLSIHVSGRIFTFTLLEMPSTVRYLWLSIGSRAACLYRRWIICMSSERVWCLINRDFYNTVYKMYCPFGSCVDMHGGDAAVATAVLYWHVIKQLVL